jgi:hypothetical protein
LALATSIGGDERRQGGGGEGGGEGGEGGGGGGLAVCTVSDTPLTLSASAGHTGLSATGPINYHITHIHSHPYDHTQTHVYV